MRDLDMFHGLYHCTVSHMLLQAFEEVKKKRKFYDKLLANTGECGFTIPTPIQRQVLPLLLHHREVLAVAPTGDLSKYFIFPWPIACTWRLNPMHGLNEVTKLSSSRLCVRHKVPGKHWHTYCQLSSTPKWLP